MIPVGIKPPPHPSVVYLYYYHCSVTFFQKSERKHVQQRISYSIPIKPRTCHENRKTDKRSQFKQAYLRHKKAQY